MQALLGLSAAAFQALCKLLSAPEAGEQLVRKLHQVLPQLPSADGERDRPSAAVQTSLSVRVWRLPGCHEFLAALGFDLCEVGREEVLLKTGKQASRRAINFALQSLLVLFDSTDLPNDVSVSSSSSLESLSSSPSASQPPSFPASPPRPSSPSAICRDALSGDAISVYSLSSLTSSLSFLPRPEPAGSDVDSQRSRPQEGAETPGRSRRTTDQSKGEAGDEDYQGYAIISSEPLGLGDFDAPPAGHHHTRGGDREMEGGGGSATTSTSVSPKKAPPPKVPPKPQHKQEISSPQRSVPAGKGKTCSSESDRSSTETDSTVKSQEERSMPPGQLDPQELARKILEETQGHMRAVESLQRAAGRRSLSTPTTPILSRGARAFQPSETSAFSRPPSRTSLGALPLSPLLPRPPCRSSSLQKLVPSSSPKRLTSLDKESHLKPSSGSESQRKPPGRESRVGPSTGRQSHLTPSSSIEPHLRPSAGSESKVKPFHSKSHLRPSTGREPNFKPSPGSESHLKLSLIPSPSPRAVPRPKSFKAARQHEGASPASLLPGKKMSTVKKDVLGLLDLSPRCEPTEGLDHVHRVDTKAPAASKPPKRTKFPAGYKFLAGHFFPSSKC